MWGVTSGHKKAPRDVQKDKDAKRGKHSVKETSCTAEDTAATKECKERRMGNAIRIRMRMKEKSEQMDLVEQERKIVSLMQQGLKRAEIAKRLDLTAEEVYQVARMYRLEVGKGSGGTGKAVRIKGLM